MLYGVKQTEQIRRDLRIWEMRRQGLSYRTIAQSYGLREDTVGRIVRKQREERRNDAEHLDAWDNFQESMMKLEATAGQLALEAVTSSSPRARVAAISARMQVVAKQINLLSDAGLLPRGIRSVGELAIRRLGQDLYQLADEHGLPDEVADAVVHCVASWVQREVRPEKRPK